MEQPGLTLNQDPANAGLGDSSSPDAPHYDPDGPNIVSTVEDIEVDDLDLEGEAGESSEETLKTDEAGQKAGEKEAGGEDQLPFHKHPRWQEVQTEKEQLKSEVAAMKAEMERLKTSVPAPKEKLPYIDITKIDEDKLREWQADDPKGYAANLYAQMRYELDQEFGKKTEQQKVQEGIRSTIDTYRDKNKDFDPMWAKGEIQAYMNLHPGHNPMSAHQMMTAEKKLNEAIEAAKKEAREETLKQLRAKKHAQVLGSGPSVSRAPAEETELINTKQKGGLTSVLAARLQKMRKAG
jgi:hypothetical protein